jgi:hypothetical protein
MRQAAAAHLFKPSRYGRSVARLVAEAQLFLHRDPISMMSLWLRPRFYSQR